MTLKKLQYFSKNCLYLPRNDTKESNYYFQEIKSIRIKNNKYLFIYLFIFISGFWSLLLLFIGFWS